MPSTYKLCLRGGGCGGKPTPRPFQAWWYTPAIPEFRKLRQLNSHRIEVILGYLKNVSKDKKKNKTKNRQTIMWEGLTRRPRGQTQLLLFQRI